MEMERFAAPDASGASAEPNPRRLGTCVAVLLARFAVRGGRAVLRGRDVSASGGCLYRVFARKQAVNQLQQTCTYADCKQGEREKPFRVRIPRGG